MAGVALALLGTVFGEVCFRSQVISA